MDYQLLSFNDTSAAEEDFSESQREVSFEKVNLENTQDVSSAISDSERDEEIPACIDNCLMVK